MSNDFNFRVFVDFVENNTQEALAYCIQTAERYFRMNLTAKEMNTLRSHHFGFCLFCAGIYGYAKRKGIDDRMLPKYVLNRAKDSLAILRSYIYT